MANFGTVDRQQLEAFEALISRTAQAGLRRKLGQLEIGERRAVNEIIAPLVSGGMTDDAQYLRAIAGLIGRGSPQAIAGADSLIRLKSLRPQRRFTPVTTAEGIKPFDVGTGEVGQVIGQAPPKEAAERFTPVQTAEGIRPFGATTGELGEVIGQPPPKEEKPEKFSRTITRTIVPGQRRTITYTNLEQMRDRLATVDKLASALGVLKKTGLGLDFLAADVDLKAQWEEFKRGEKDIGELDENLQDYATEYIDLKSNIEDFETAGEAPSAAGTPEAPSVTGTPETLPDVLPGETQDEYIERLRQLGYEITQ